MRSQSEALEIKVYSSSEWQPSLDEQQISINSE